MARRGRRRKARSSLRPEWLWGACAFLLFVLEPFLLHSYFDARAGQAEQAALECAQAAAAAHTARVPRAPEGEPAEFPMGEPDLITPLLVRDPTALIMPPLGFEACPRPAVLPRVPETLREALQPVPL